MSFNKFLFLLLLGISNSIIAQEFVTGIQINEAVAIEAEKMALEEALGRSINEDVSERVLLPFFDDFSTSNIFPNQNLWTGYSVFVNKDFAYMPVNIGVATLDAIDSTGNVYKDASWVPVQADNLTSRYIRLDSIFSPIPRKLTPTDSVFLSFFYQPQGVGDSPQSFDSLVLEYSRHTGDIVFSHMDSVFVEAKIYMQSPNDTIWPLDTLWAPLECNPDVFTINYKIITWNDTIEVACDSVFVPEIVWDKIWYSEGMSLEEFNEFYGKNMVQVNIPILDTSYFNNNFRFRFRNYITVSNDNYPPSWRSNGDQWNIDYVYLNYNRTAGDTTYRALTFSQRAPSFLENYEVMPYRQYRHSAYANTRQDFNMYISNLDNIEHNTKYSYHVKQVNVDFGFDYFGGSCNLLPFYENGFQNCQNCATHACPPVVSTFSEDYNLDTTSYIITHYISDSSENSIVDSAIYRQGFYNYFAYDDGTPELGWGVDGSGGAQVAYQFKLSVSDTLWGVQMYFNRTLNDANEFFFDLLIWSDNNGKPGEIIYRMDGQKVKWKKGRYSFYPYMLDEPFVVVGSFYVGWEKIQKDNMNIGMDANNDRHDKIFYKTDVEWQTSTVPGALLIRPIVGSSLILNTEDLTQENITNSLKLYPNPASTCFSIGNDELINNSFATVSIFNMYGQLVYYQVGINSKTDISNLESGIYIVNSNAGFKHYSSKLLINR